MEKMNNNEHNKDNIINKVKRNIGIGVLAAASAISAAPQDVEAKDVNNTFEVSHEVSQKYHISDTFTVDEKTKNFFKKKGLSLKTFSTNGVHMTCVMKNGIGIYDLCKVERHQKVYMIYMPKLKQFLAQTTNQDGAIVSREIIDADFDKILHFSPRLAAGFLVGEYENPRFS